MPITHKTTEDGCIEILVVKDGFTEIGWVSSMHLVHTKEQQLLRVIERKAAASFVVPPIHDA